MICPCCGKEWNTDINNSCICGAVITEKSYSKFGEAQSAYSLLDEVLERVDKWLMINSNIDVEKIVDMKIEVRKHFV